MLTNFEYSVPTRIVYGPGQVSRLGALLRGFGKSAFVITSRSFGEGQPRAHVLAGILDQLRKLGVETSVFDQVSSNPTSTAIDEAAAKARLGSFRYILAVGGGSVMDAAKMVAMLCKNPGNAFDYAYKGPGTQRASFQTALPIVCVPTHAATGSEANFFSVLTEPQLKRKVTAFGAALMPSMALLDPALTVTVPREQTIDGAFDMITHVMESYLSSPGESPFQDEMTEGFVRSVCGALDRVLENPADLASRGVLSWAACFALSGAFSGRTGPWPIHAIEHGITAFAPRVSHGRGLAILLPRVMAFNAARKTECMKKAQQFEQRVFGKEGGLEIYMRSVGAWSHLKDYGVTSDELPSFIEQVLDHAMETKGVWVRGQDPFIDNIVPIDRAEGRALLRSCY
jgi:alcohol dehydrogenase YqhD (iron-dependent ADH family)